VPWLLALPLALGFARLGVNAEQVGGLHLYPLQQVVSGYAPEPARCDSGRFVQPQRPIAGVCVGEVRLPVLFNAYTSTLVYWPLIALAELLPGHGGASLRFVALLGLVAVLALVQRLVATPRAPPGVAALAPVLLVLTPSYAFYGSMYIYEYAGCLGVLAAWLLLRRFGEGGSPCNALAAMLLLGLAVATKWTYVLVVVPFFVSYLWVCGLPLLSRTMWLLAAAAALLPTCAVLVFAAGLPHEAAALQSRAGAGLSLAQLPGYIAHLFWGPPTALLPLPTLIAEVLGMTAGLALLAWCAIQVRAAVRGQQQSPVVLVACATVVGSLLLVLAVYLTNPTSMPILQYTPFLAIAAAAALVALARCIARPSAGWWVGLGIAVWMLAAQAVPLGALALVVKLPPHVVMAEQAEVARQLAELLRGRTVAMPASDFDGVLEFVSSGAVRPLYFALDRRESELTFRDPGTDFVLLPIESDEVSGFNSPATRRLIRQLRERISMEYPNSAQHEVRSTDGQVLFALVQLRP